MNAILRRSLGTTHRGELSNDILALFTVWRKCAAPDVARAIEALIHDEVTTLRPISALFRRFAEI